MCRSVVILIIGIFCAGSLQAQTRPRPSSPWVAAANGIIPAGAIPYGHEADGRDQFVCRAAHDGGMHAGRIASGFDGCIIGYGGLEVIQPHYEVLTRQRERRPDAASEAERANAAAAAAQPPAPSTPQVQRGFDVDGTPYVITHFPDGTVERRTPRGAIRTKPDGTREEFREPVYAHVPIGSPPELPSDPKQGRLWMEMHNMQLLDMIRALVNDSDSEMQKLEEAERKASSDGLFEQISYRTKVAMFLAKGR